MQNILTEPVQILIRDTAYNNNLFLNGKTEIESAFLSNRFPDNYTFWVMWLYLYADKQINNALKN